MSDGVELAHKHNLPRAIVDVMKPDAKHGVSLHELMAIGRENPDNPHEEFCMTVLGLKLSRRVSDPCNVIPPWRRAA